MTSMIKSHYMKLIFFVLTSIISINLTYAQTLYPYLSLSGKWGFVESDMDPSIKPTFEYAHPIIDGLAAVMKNDLWGYLNESGKLIVKHKYYDLEEPSEGLVAVQDPSSMKWGYIDYEGNIELDFIYDDAGPFKFNLAPVALNGEYAYINKKGQIRFGGFNYITPFNHDGFSQVQHKLGKPFIFDKTGKKYTELPVYYYELPSEGFYIKIEYGKYGYVNVLDNSVAISCQYDMAYQFR